jgi:hypothetical protein
MQETGKPSSENSPFVWDKYSDQPHIIKDKAYKKKMRKRYTFDYILMFLTNLIIFPLSIILMKFFKKNKNQTTQDKYFYALGVNLDKGDMQQQLVEELGVKSLIIRIPLNDIHNLERYYNFAKSFGEDKQILINIMQDRANIDDLELLKLNIIKIFDKFKTITDEYQIGTTINRAKWGFFSVVEYLKFYKTVQDIKNSKYPTIKLIGPSVIDFEYHYTIRALFNNFDISFDKLSSLLYVDRRGAPQNKQMGIFDTKNKIDMLFSLVKLSPKMKSDDIYITEVNWPLSNTAPYAPTSEKECVDEDSYAKYMVDYFLIAKKSNKVSKVFWHQLIAPGYGLVDNRDGKIRKTKAFYEFKKLLQNCNKSL